MSSNARLLVLGILLRKKLHGYEIQRLLEQSQTAQWARVLPGSIYHALKALEHEGLVLVSDTEDQGHRKRAIYDITDAGKVAYAQLLRDALARRPDSLPSDFYVALGFIDDIPPDVALGLINGLIDGIERDRAAWDHGETQKVRQMDVPERLHALFDNGRDHYDADLRLLRRLRVELGRKPPPPPRR